MCIIYIRYKYRHDEQNLEIYCCRLVMKFGLLHVFFVIIHGYYLRVREHP